MEREIFEVVYKTEKLRVPAKGDIPAHDEWAVVLEYVGEKPSKYVVIHDLDLSAEHVVDYATTAELLFGFDLEEAKKKADEIYRNIESKLNQQ